MSSSHDERNKTHEELLVEHFAKLPPVIITAIETNRAAVEALFTKINTDMEERLVVVEVGNQILAKDVAFITNLLVGSYVLSFLIQQIENTPHIMPYIQQAYNSGMDAGYAYAIIKGSVHH